MSTPKTATESPEEAAAARLHPTCGRSSTLPTIEPAPASPSTYPTSSPAQATGHVSGALPLLHLLKVAICCTGCNQPFTSELAYRTPIEFVFCPWEDSSNWSDHVDNLAPLDSQDYTTPFQSFIRHPNARFIIDTDGSATGGTLGGGVETVATEGDPANPTSLPKKQQRGTAITSSYDKEKAAVRMALDWLLPSHEVAVIFTDSQSLLKVIQSGLDDISDIRHMPNKRAGKTTLLGIPVHHGIAGNEEADACVKQVTAITGRTPRPVSFAAASARIRRTDPLPCHCRTNGVYTNEENSHSS